MAISPVTSGFLPETQLRSFRRRYGCSTCSPASSPSATKTSRQAYPAVEQVNSSEICRTGTISNNEKLNKYAVVAYAGILLWLGISALVGMGLIWIVFKIALVVLGPLPSIRELGTSFVWVGWTAYAIAGLLLGILAWYLHIQFIAKRRVDRLHSKLQSVVTPEEKRRFEELNTLYGSKDLAERDRFLKLAGEYQQKVREALSPQIGNSRLSNRRVLGVVQEKPR